jgi:hypothetical protein
MFARIRKWATFLHVAWSICPHFIFKIKQLKKMRPNKTELMKPAFVMLDLAFAISFMNYELCFILIWRIIHVNARYKVDFFFWHKVEIFMSWIFVCFVFATSIADFEIYELWASYFHFISLSFFSLFCFYLWPNCSPSLILAL